MNDITRAFHDPAPDEVLRQRAAKLALPAVPRAAAGERQALHFSLAGRPCLLELAWVREIQRLRGLVPIPLGASHLLGLAPWRGRMLPVLDLAFLLAIPQPAAAAEPQHLIVLGHPAAEAALAVGEIHGMQALPPGEAELRARPLEGLRPDMVRGVTAAGQLLLDGERLLALHRAAP